MAAPKKTGLTASEGKARVNRAARVGSPVKKTTDDVVRKKRRAADLERATPKARTTTRGKNSSVGSGTRTTRGETSAPSRELKKGLFPGTNGHIRKAFARTKEAGVNDFGAYGNSTWSFDPLTGDLKRNMKVTRKPNA